MENGPPQGAQSVVDESYKFLNSGGALRAAKWEALGIEGIARAPHQV